ncbi:MBL fold metallo-hydrolase [Amylibacter sp.]|nr:MBL fold metallo-hydrolase [Amylibacter sp.]
MKVTKLGSATVFIETEDLKILCDPWLVDGIYHGSWCNYPPVDIESYNFSDLDFVYVSHIHPDHFDPKTLSRISKNVPILVHNYHKKFLKINIERLGFSVIELDNGIPCKLSENTKFTIFAADDCDPTICGRMFGCITSEIKGSMQLDSLCVVDDGNHILVNTNDCPYGIAKHLLKKIKLKYETIDFALVGYTSASLYPHCMIDYDQTKMQLSKAKTMEIGLTSGFETLKVLRPKYFLPFAGTYIIGGKYHYKNKDIPLPEIQDAASELESRLKLIDLQSKAVLLNNGEYFDLVSSEQSSIYTPINVNKRNLYIKNVASKFEYDFEHDEEPDPNVLIELFDKGFERLKLKQEELQFYDDINLVFDIHDNLFCTINLKKKKLYLLKNIKELTNYHRFSVDTRLLKKLLMGPKYANWNNVEIGGLLGFSRYPDQYRMDIHILVNALHA